jgi:hypothetical protein
MSNKRQRTTQSPFQTLPSTIIPQIPIRNNFNLLPNEIILCIFDYLLPIDIIRAFEYDLPRYGALIKQHILIHGFNLLKIKSNDSHLIPICLSLINQQQLSICTRDNYLSVILKSVPTQRTLTVILNTPFEQSFVSTIQHETIICDKLILEYTPSYHRQMNDSDIIPLLSSSVKILILRNVVFLLGRIRVNYICETLHHIRCILKSENDLYELLIRFPMLISIDIRLVSNPISNLSTVLPLPKHFRIEYPYGTILNLDNFPEATRYYDQTVYSLPWNQSNSSLVLRSCNSKNYLHSFPHPLPDIRQLTIECTSEPWSLEFVSFLHQTFPNTRTLYALQEHHTNRLIMTTITANGRCTLNEPFREASTDWTSLPEATRFIYITRAYN